MGFSGSVALLGVVLALPLKTPINPNTATSATKTMTNNRTVYSV